MTQKRTFQIYRYDPDKDAKPYMQTIQVGIRKMIVTSDALTEWPIVMATAILAMLPPVAVVILMQKLFVRGLVETEK